MESSTTSNVRDRSDKPSGPKGLKLRRRVSDLWEGLRRWVDEDEDPASKFQEHARSLHRSESFLKAVALELEKSLADEAFVPPGLPLCVPEGFIVFLDPETDKEWIGSKRRALAQALNNSLLEKMRDIAKEGGIESGAPAVTLKVDGTLKKDQIRIKALWGEGGSDNTMVVHPQGERVYDPDATHVYVPSESLDGDATQVIIAGGALYTLEVWRSDACEAVIPVSSNRITVGRGAKALPVDVRLQDPNVSRRHMTLEYDSDGTIWVTHHGQNPTTVGGHQVIKNERVRVVPDESICVSVYKLRVVRN